MTTASAWTLPDPVLDSLDERLAELRPKLALECGSGASTTVLGYHADRLVTLEHLQRFANQTVAQLPPPLIPKVELRVAPIRDMVTPAGVFPFYDTVLPDSIEFALIDGPPGAIGRAGTLFAIAPKLAPGAEIWLDDAGRAGERAALRLWEQHLGAVSHPHPDHPRVAVIRILESLSPYRRFQGLHT